MRMFGPALVLALAIVAQTGPVSALPLCGEGKRISCVVDGDTFWLSGEKFRIESIDAPEIEGRCRSERVAAQRAKLRLAELLSSCRLELRRSGVDRFGRTLVIVRAAGRDVGKVLIREGHARPWRGKREGWCDAGR